MIQRVSGIDVPVTGSVSVFVTVSTFVSVPNILAEYQWYLVSSTWHLVSGILYLVSGIRERILLIYIMQRKLQESANRAG